MMPKFMPFVVRFLLLLLFALFLARANPPRLSQMETAANVVQQSPSSSQQWDNSVSADDNNNFAQSQPQQQQQRRRHAVCPNGWLNFRDEQCFYGLSQIKMPFFYGVRACAQIEAGFSSVHSMDEFRFITANFDLRRFWIGIFYGSSHFEDGTKVDQELFEQISPMVPWAPPETAKGFVCRANAQFN